MKKRFIILVIFLCFILIIRYFGSDVLSLELFKKYHSSMLEAVEKNYWYAVGMYILFYIITVAFAVPATFVVTMAGGYLFNVFPGVLYVNIGATVGATCAFLVSRYLIGNWVQQVYGHRLTKLNYELQQYGIYYLLMARLILILPFFMVNLLAGLTRISVWQFIWTTSLGIIPASIAFAYAGKQIMHIRSVHDILSLSVIIAFIIVGLLVLLPVIFRRRFFTEVQK